MRLGDDERRVLLQIARLALGHAVSACPGFEERLADQRVTPALEEPRGAFVSLKQQAGKGAAEELRGCIGCIESERPLYRTVIDAAGGAALRDPRFPPVEPDELDRLRIEVSALDRLVAVDGPDAIVAGRHGVRLCKEGKTAVFLPQVAGDRGWSTAKLLKQLAIKAGLPEDGWRGAALAVFEAEVFGEPRSPAQGASGSR